jgi:predicted RND superfamily exporter protein
MAAGTGARRAVMPEVPVPRAIAALLRWRAVWLAIFTVLFLGLAGMATQLSVDAGFEKMIPLDHPYMQTLRSQREAFGGANRILVAVARQDAQEIYTADFLATLRDITDAIFFLPGVDRATVSSLHTPNVRFIEIIEEGFAGGDVIPAGFRGTAEQLVVVRDNVLKSGQLGRLVANDHRAAMISAQLLEIDPWTGQRLDYRAVAAALEAIRAQYSTDTVHIHIIGFAKMVGDIADGARGVLQFFGFSFLSTALLLFLYTGSYRLTGVTLVCALLPVVGVLGLLPLLGLGIDPLSILLPFLLFAIAVSHAVQMTQAWRVLVMQGAIPRHAAQQALHQVWVPGTMALVTTATGFLVILHIEIRIVQELALTAGLGVLLMLVTNLLVLPLLLSYLPLTPDECLRGARRIRVGDRLWQALRPLTDPRQARWVLLVALVLLAGAAWQSRALQTGDLGSGVPELRPDARYNQDVAAITSTFSIGVNVLTVFARSAEGACTDHAVMERVDHFERTLRSVEGVQSVLGLAGLARRIHAGWNEGDPRWQALPRAPTLLAQAVTPVDTGSGLLNTDCSILQILIFTEDHAATTLARVIGAVERFQELEETEGVEFVLAAGNLGVMAATNDAVDAAAPVLLLLVFGTIAALCLLEFRSWNAMLCIVLPLAMVAVFCSALMAWLGIGLKVSTLPVIAIAVGIGVDYGIYLYERIAHYRSRGRSLADAYLEALRVRGTAVLFTAATMSIGVGLWMFSALKFQADMGLLLAFMFLVNVLAVLILLPALAAALLPERERRAGSETGDWTPQPK